MAETLDMSRKIELAPEATRMRAAGRPKDACPFPMDSAEREAWMEGFDGEPAREGPDIPMDDG